MAGKKAKIFSGNKRKCGSAIIVAIMVAFIIIVAGFLRPGKLLSQVAVALDNFYGVAIVDDQAWAVGYHGDILHGKVKEQTWTIQPSGTRQSLFAVCFIDSKQGWTVGEGGTILVTGDGGKTWSSQKGGVNKDLFDVCFIDQNQGWASGVAGTLLHTSDGGKHWENQSTPQDIDFYGLTFVDHQRGWLAGEFGTIFHTIDSGKTWIKQQNPIEISPDSGKSQCLFKIRFADHLKGWAAGMDGEILQTTDGGKNWRLLKQIMPKQLFYLCVKEGGFVAVGAKGIMIDGRYNPPQGLVLGSVDFNAIDLKGELGLIVGNKGTILYSSDGGKSWKRSILTLSSQKREVNQ